jgi:prevent-host-death family protein
MESVGIRELKQNASEVVARVERGETIDITVQGRRVAQIVPIAAPGPRRWVPGAVLNAGLAELGPDTTGWLEEWYESRTNDPIEDPWERYAR